MSAVQTTIDALGGYEAPALPSRPLGTLLFLLTVCAVGWIERAQFSLKALEGSKWWASNGRDVLNVVALVLLILGLRAIGFRGPLSFCLAGAFVIILSAVQMTLDKHRHQLALSVGLGLLLALPVVAFPAEVDSAVTSLLIHLFRP